ncbi:hypothetical protein, partial [Hydrogenophaga borbori]|uniref:hypothetical protein n=1 Tax=Hydrogenophaga borbori TaxID=2294117 RepID=UPI00301C00E7
MQTAKDNEAPVRRPLPPLAAVLAYRWRPRGWLVSEPRRQTFAWSVSLLVHALILSLTFGDGLDLPGLELPWKERRTEVPELRARLSPPPAPPAEAAPPASVSAPRPTPPAPPSAGALTVLDHAALQARRQEAQRQEALRQEAARREAQRAEAARQLAERRAAERR